MQLLSSHLLVDRDVAHNDDGTILARTTSDDAAVASLLQEHVHMMQARVEDSWYIRGWDPFFVELFDRHKEFDMKVTDLSNGVESFLSASTDCGQAIIENHVDVVSLFVKTGHQEAMKEHAVPEACWRRSGPIANPVPNSDESESAAAAAEADLTRAVITDPTQLATAAQTETPVVNPTDPGALVPAQEETDKQTPDFSQDRTIDSLTTEDTGASTQDSAVSLSIAAAPTACASFRVVTLVVAVSCSMYLASVF